MMWEDSEEYYAQPNFLAYELELPYSLVYPKGGALRDDGTQDLSSHMSVDQHFALVHHQLTQMRNALALAKALNRVLILPRLVCGLDRWWAPHSGIIPGSAARLPLLECPADHVIDLERMGKPEKILREHSMLCNPRTPGHVLKSMASVQMPSFAEPLSSKPIAAAEELLTRLNERTSLKVLKLTGRLPDYRAFLSGSKRDAFEAEVKGYAGLWCCNRPPGGRGAGHIWYDFLWDVVPHRDRHNRQWKEAWKPIMGP
uniref:Uncharacterized protein n=1 Tax=Calcidiscus leptoporus TaxID=127549 RepID=A0A7S0JHJ1_9EUKA